jgi:tetratricopeptide (TPR) repeat protein
MKSERRHELEQNELAIWIGQTVKAIEPYSKAILAGAALVVVVILLIAWWKSQSAVGAEEAWRQFFLANNLPTPQQKAVEFDHIADENAKLVVGQWAALMSGNYRFLQATEDLLTANRATAVDSLDKAAKSYQLVIDNSRDSGLREESLWGIARVHESLAGVRRSGGDLAKAIEHYNTLANSFPNGPYTKEAKRRVEDLSSKDIRAFCERFAEYTPPSRTPPGMPGQSPFEGTLPGGLGSDTLPDLGSALPGLEPPKPGTSKPDASKPEAKPDTSKPEAKAAPTLPEAPKVEAPKGEPAKPEAPKGEPAKK